MIKVLQLNINFTDLSAENDYSQVLCACEYGNEQKLYEEMVNRFLYELAEKAKCDEVEEELPTRYNPGEHEKADSMSKLQLEELVSLFGGELSDTSLEYDMSSVKYELKFVEEIPLYHLIR